MNRTTIDGLVTPAPIVDRAVFDANLDRMSAYTNRHGLALRPHIKTHKTREIAAEQIRRGAAGITVATMREAHVMADVASDILIAYPPVGDARLSGIMALPEHVRVTVALDSAEALNGLSRAAAAAKRTIGVLIEMDLGMHRTGVDGVQRVVELAGRARDASAITYRGLMFYPGHIRQHTDQQQPALATLRNDLRDRIEALDKAALAPSTVSAGSTPAAFVSHTVAGLTEIRPGTYVFNDRTTAAIGACAPSDCALTVLATVVSTAVPGQAVIDAGSKALGREPLRAGEGSGFGALMDHPDVIVSSMSEEHGILDIGESDWRPRIGDRVRIVPNHVCYVVNLHPRLHVVDGESTVVATYEVAARGWTD